MLRGGVLSVMGAAGCSEGVDGEGGDIIASVKAQGRGVHMAFLCVMRAGFNIQGGVGSCAVV